MERVYVFTASSCARFCQDSLACGLHNSRQSKIITTKVHFCQKSSRIELRHDSEAAVRVMRFSTLGGNGLLVAFSTRHGCITT